MFQRKSRIDQHGMIYLTGADPAQEASLDSRFPRTRPGERRWAPLEDGDRSVASLGSIYAGAHAVLAGKGPSIDEADIVLEDGTILVAINEAALVLEGVSVVVALDLEVIQRLNGRWPAGALVLVPAQFLRSVEGAKDVAYINTGAEDGRCMIARGSGAVALRCLEQLGVAEVTMLGFDSLTGDTPAADRYAYSGRLRRAGVPDRAERSFEQVNREIRTELAASGISCRNWTVDGEVPVEAAPPAEPSPATARAKKPRVPKGRR